MKHNIARTMPFNVNCEIFHSYVLCLFCNYFFLKEIIPQYICCIFAPFKNVNNDIFLTIMSKMAIFSFLSTYCILSTGCIFATLTYVFVFSEQKLQDLFPMPLLHLVHFRIYHMQSLKDDFLLYLRLVSMVLYHFLV